MRTKQLLLLLLAIGLTGSGCQPSGSGPLGPGQVLPPLQAEGWFNGSAPTPSDLLGQVVVIQCWAYW